MFIELKIMGTFDKLFNKATWERENETTELTLDQKYAIVGLMIFIQGFSPHSAYDKRATDIVQSTISSLGLSMQQVTMYLHQADGDADMLISNLKSIRNKDLLNSIYDKCSVIAEISQVGEAKEILQYILQELKYQ